MKSEIYINEQILELYPNTVIATTFQIFDLGGLRDYQVNHTNRIKVPKTALNKEALGFAEEISSSARNPYKKHNIRILQDGVEIIPDGVGVINSVDNDYQITVYSGLFDLFEVLNGLTLHDITTLSNYDHEWTRINGSNSALNTSGYIYPAIQYGTMKGTHNNLDMRYTFPSFFVHTLVSDLIQDQGFSKSGSILSDDFYLKWALPFSQSKYKHSDRFANERSFENQLGQTYVMGDTYSATTTNKLASLLPLQPNQTFTNIGSSTIDCTINITVTDFSKSAQSGDSVSPKIAIYKNSGGTPVVLASQTITADNSYTVSLAGISLTNGETLEAAILADYVNTTGIPSAYGMKITSCSMYSAPIERNISFGETVTPEAYLPKYNQKEFLKAVGQMLGLIFVVDSRAKKITFRQVSEIFKNKHKAKDWSSKLVKPDTYDPEQWYVNKETILSNQYGQKSYLRYKNDDTVISEYGDSYLDVNNETLEKTKDIVNLPWAASESDLTMLHNKYLAVIPFWEDDGAGGWQEVKEKPQQRFVYIDRADSTLDYIDGSGTFSVAIDAPYAKFKDPTEAKNLDFVNLKANHYSEFQNALTDAVKLTALFYLTPVDVVDFDHFTPVYVDRFDGFFYVNRIINFVRGKVTKVELVKI